MQNLLIKKYILKYITKNPSAGTLNKLSFGLTLSSTLARAAFVRVLLRVSQGHLRQRWA